MTPKKTISQTLGWLALGALLGAAPALIRSNSETQNEQSAANTSQLNAPAQQSIEKKSELSDPRPEDPKPSKEPEETEGANSTREIGLTEIASLEEHVPFVKRLVVASTVKNREPTEIKEGKLGEPVVAFVELKNGSDQDEKIVVTFEHESGKEVGFIELAVPKEATRYRTWGRTRNIRDPGIWSAIVRAEDGTELSRRTFNVAG